MVDTLGLGPRCLYPRTAAAFYGVVVQIGTVD